MLQVTLTVDEQYKERWTSLGTFNMLASSQVFVGGAPHHLTLRSQRKGSFLHHKTDLPQNFIGCMRKVRSSLLALENAESKKIFSFSCMVVLR